MEISIKSITLLSAVLLTGLSAGLFYAWQVSVIPGTKKIMAMTYLQTMQSINKAILNPAFFLIFMGSLFLLIISTIQQFQTGATFWLMVASTLVYLFGTFGVTAFGNVPLNNELESLSLSNLSSIQVSEFRLYYEVNWNRLHLIRTGFSVISFLLSLMAVFSYTKSI